METCVCTNILERFFFSRFPILSLFLSLSLSLSLSLYLHFPFLYRRSIAIIARYIHAYSTILIRFYSLERFLAAHLQQAIKRRENGDGKFSLQKDFSEWAFV